MPSNLTDVDSFDTVTGPVASDIRNAASVRSALQTLANRTRYLFNRIDALADIAALKAIDTTGLPNNYTKMVKGQGVYSLDTASGAAELQPFIVAPTTGPGRWISATAHLTTRTVRVWPGNHLIGWQADAAGTSPDVGLGSGVGSAFVGDTLDARYYGGLKPTAASAINRHWYGVSLDPYVLEGATLTSVVFRVAPANHSDLPANMPYVSVVRNHGSSLGAHLLSTGGGSVVDPSANVAAFNAEHSITFTPDQNNVIDRSQYGYQAFIGDEGGANSLQGAWWRYIDLTFTVPDARGT